MNSKSIFFLLVIFSLVVYLFNFDKIASNFFYEQSDKLKNSYMKILTSIKDTKNQYFNQVDTINTYETRIDKNKNYKLLYDATKTELDKLQNDLNTSNPLEFDTIYTKVVSYVHLNDFSKVTLDKEIPTKAIFPLLTPDGYAAGIVLRKENRTIGLLNNNEKCNYAVFIGNVNAPGITSGANEQGEIIIQHIPKWFSINIGDEVITSGMDHIFPTGTKVGTITNVEELINTKKAYVKPYVDVLTKKHFYMIKKRNTIF